MNKLSKEKIILKSLIGGGEYSLSKYTLRGTESGPCVYMQASLHGGELQGNAVILSLIEELKSMPLKGSLIFVPLSNPYATNCKIGKYTFGRFNPNTGDNWNRNFIDIIDKLEIDLETFCKKFINESEVIIREKFKLLLNKEIIKYQKKLEQNNKLHDNNNLNLILQKIASKADVVLDLHTGPSATEYLYSATRSIEDAEYLHFKYVLEVEHEFAGAMDEATFMPWVHLTNSFKAMGRDIQFNFHSFTLELTSEEGFSMSQAKKQKEKILNYLRYKGLINGDSGKKKIIKCPLANYETIFTPVSGLIDYSLELGKPFKKGDLLGTIYQFHNLDDHSFSKHIHPVRANEDGYLINRCPSSAVVQGMELFQVISLGSSEK